MGKWFATYLEWHRASSAASKGILNVALIESNLKVLMRWYTVPLKIAKIYLNASPLCFRNFGHVGSILHIWWECPKISGLWNRIFHTIKKITGLPIRKSPQFTLLNFPYPEAPKLVQRLIRFIFFGAKLTIAKTWKQPTVSFLLVKRSMDHGSWSRKTVSILLDTAEKHEATWEPWACVDGRAPHRLTRFHPFFSLFLQVSLLDYYLRTQCMHPPDLQEKGFYNWLR